MRVALLACLLALQVDSLGDDPLIWSDEKSWASVLEFVDDMNAENKMLMGEIEAFSDTAASTWKTVYASSRAIECTPGASRYFLMLTDATPTDIRITMKNAHDQKVINSKLTGEHSYHWDCRVGFVRKVQPENLLELVSKIAPTSQVCGNISLSWTCPDFNSDTFRRSKSFREFTGLPGEFVVISGVSSAPYVLAQYDFDLAEVRRASDEYPVMNSKGKLTRWNEANSFPSLLAMSRPQDVAVATHALLYLVIGLVNGAVGGALAGVACSWCLWRCVLSSSSSLD